MEKLDILNRDEFVDRLLKLIENISANKTSTCFALNGEWGCGKTFVLDMLEERLRQIQSPEIFDDKYFVIHYNCWKYDYYEEPLIAIVATIISAVEEATKLIPDSENKQKALGVLKKVGRALASILNKALKLKTGIDALAVYDTVREGIAEGKAVYEESHSYDVFFDFNQVMQGLKEELKILSEERMIVFVVDELDRCLPEYAVKVLERLHHLTEDSRNTITIVSVDKEKLTKSIDQLFAIDQPSKYLEKFIRFEVELDYGTVNASFSEKHKDYYALFDKDIFTFDDSVKEFIKHVFGGIPIRTQEQLVERAMVAHNLLFTDKKDYSFMCMELLLTIMICVYNNNMDIPLADIENLDYTNLFVQSETETKPPFLDFFNAKFGELYLEENIAIYSGAITRIIVGKVGLYGAILFLWYWVHKKSEKYTLGFPPSTNYDKISKNYKDLKKFADTIKLIS